MQRLVSLFARRQNSVEERGDDTALMEEATMEERDTTRYALPLRQRSFCNTLTWHVIGIRYVSG